MALTPEQLAAPNTEHAHQVALFCWAAGKPQLTWLYAIPNGGERDRIVAGRLKAEGVKSGVWDIHLPVASSGYVGLWIEMKKPTRRKQAQGGLSDEQWAFGLDMHAQGYKTAVCYTWLEARDAIRGYLGLNDL